MDEIEDLLGRYRPAGPPPELRARLTDRHADGRARASIAGWLLVAATLCAVLLFHTLAAREDDRMLTRIPPPLAARTLEAFEEPWR